MRPNALRVCFPTSFVFALEASLKGLRRKQSLTERMSEFWASARGASGQNRMGLAVTGDAVSAWFVREILPLEAILMHYLRSNWRNPSDIPDLRQEIYTRVFEAARESIPDNPKRFLLTTARNLLINLVRRQQVVPMETFADLDVFAIAADAPQADRLVIEQQELLSVQTALSELPARTRQAIELAYFEGLSRTEIAKRMGTTQQVASRSVARGTLILGRILYGAPTDRSAKS
jgi:RNA polymerase sigma factor (sigma-70 family)